MSFGNVIDSGNNSQSIDLQEVNYLSSQIEMNERKQPSEGDNPSHSNTTKRRTISGSVPYHSPQFHPQMVPSWSNNNSIHNPNQSIPTKPFDYRVAAYHILVHLLLLYCVIGVTYLWFIKNTINCECPQIVTESNASFYTPNPIVNPQSNPTANPTTIPSYLQTNAPLNISNDYFNDKLNSVYIRIMDVQSDVNIMKINFTDCMETLYDIQQTLNDCECSNHPTNVPSNDTMVHKQIDDKIFNITDTKNKCICNDSISSSSTIEDIMNNLDELQQWFISLNISMAELKNSRVSVNAMEALNDTVLSLLGETATLHQNDVSLLQSAISSINNSLWMPSSMNPGWPDAITCTASVSNHTVHYLVHGPANNRLFIYRFQYGANYRDFRYNVDGSLNAKAGNDNWLIGTSNCDGKSIQDLYSEGLAFDFVVTR
eukprot:241982_1